MGGVISDGDNSSVGTVGTQINRLNSGDTKKVIAIKRRKLQANTAALPGSPINKLEMEKEDDLSN